jgi:hypothetical protein
LESSEECLCVQTIKNQQKASVRIMKYLQITISTDDFLNKWGQNGQSFVKTCCPYLTTLASGSPIIQKEYFCFQISTNNKAHLCHLFEHTPRESSNRDNFYLFITADKFDSVVSYLPEFFPCTPSDCWLLSIPILCSNLF